MFLSTLCLAILAVVSLAEDYCEPGQTLVVTDNDIKCNAELSCDGCAALTLPSGDLISCNGEASCAGANFLATATKDFALDCDAKNACSGSGNTASIDCSGVGSEDSIDGVLCKDESACAGLDTTVTGGCAMKEVICGGELSCDSSVFTLDASLESFKCSDKACSNLDASFSAQESFKLECNGEDACQPNTDFAIDCSGVEEIAGVFCDGKQSCKDMDLTVTGDCTVKEISCTDDSACEDAEIILDGPSLDSFKCDGKMSCKNCYITIDGTRSKCSTL